MRRPCHSSKNDGPVVSWHFEFSSLCMSSILKVLLRCLRILRLVREYIQKFPGRWTSLLAVLSRQLRLLWRCHDGHGHDGHGKPGALQRPKSSESLPLDTRTSRYPVPHSSISRECIIAASTVPESANHPSSQERADRQTATAAPTAGIPLTNQDTLSVDHSHSHVINPPPPFDGRNIAHHSSGNLSAVSIQSRASDRLSIITTRSSIRAVPAGQPSRLSRATYRQFGRGPDPSRSRDRSRPTTPTNQTHTHHPHLPRLEVITSNTPHSTYGNDSVHSVNQPSPSSHTHEPLSPPSMDRHRKKRSSTSLIFEVQNPSTESLPISSVMNPPPLSEEPFAVDTATAHSSPVTTPPDLYDEGLARSRTSLSDSLLPDGRFVQLINSDQIPRYMKNVTISREETPYDVKPLTTTFPHYIETSGADQDSLKQDCIPWIPETHPDGALYYYDPARRLFTDTDMHDQKLKEEMEDFYMYLQQLLHIDQLVIPSKDFDLVLDLNVTEDSRISWSYYYACHETRCLFWLETYDASYMISELNGVKSPAHDIDWRPFIGRTVVFGTRRLPLAVYDELMGILSHGCVDVLTSKSSTLPYDDETMQRMIKLVQKAKKAKGGEAYHTAGTTRLLSFFAHWRFLYFHGQKHARLVRDQTVYNEPKRERSILITLLSPLLFLAPEVHLREMEKLWTDEVIIETVWKTFMSKLLGEWEDVILWSTVMLTANVGFLAIPGVVLSNLNGTDLTNANQVNIFTSATQIASSLSVEASIGSIVIGLLLVRHNRTKQREDPAGASTYLYQNCHRTFGLEPMAIILSLPWALLMWSMVIFSIALLLLCFTISNTFTRSFVAVMSTLVAALIMWCIRTAWESTEDFDVWHNNLVVLRRTRDNLYKRVKKLGRDITDPFSTRRPQEDIRSMRSISMSERPFDVTGV